MCSHSGFPCILQDCPGVNRQSCGLERAPWPVLVLHAQDPVQNRKQNHCSTPRCLVSPETGRQAHSGRACFLLGTRSLSRLKVTSGRWHGWGAWPAFTGVASPRWHARMSRHSPAASESCISKSLFDSLLVSYKQPLWSFIQMLSARSPPGSSIVGA